MIEAEPYKLRDVVPPEEVRAWKDRIRKLQPRTQCPAEVEQFISAMADKLGDFGQIRKFEAKISGYELLLCNLKELNGQTVFASGVYPIAVPHMIAVDNYSSMLRIYRRKGKQGLIDYCKAKVKATELERVLEILNVNVFHIDRPEFVATMQRIHEAKKLELQFEQ